MPTSASASGAHRAVIIGDVIKKQMFQGARRPIVSAQKMCMSNLARPTCSTCSHRFDACQEPRGRPCSRRCWCVRNLVAGHPAVL